MNDPRNKIEWRKIGRASAAIVLLLLLVGCSGPSYQFYKATWFGKLKPGLSREAVKELVGEPNEINRRQMSPEELREVWVYLIKNLNPQNHLYPSLRMIVFSNGTMVALDPQDPYSPQLSPPASPPVEAAK